MTSRAGPRWATTTLPCAGQRAILARTLRQTIAGEGVALQRKQAAPLIADTHLRRETLEPSILAAGVVVSEAFGRDDRGTLSGLDVQHRGEPGTRKHDQRVRQIFEKRTVSRLQRDSLARRRRGHAVHDGRRLGGYMGGAAGLCAAGHAQFLALVDAA